MPQKSWRLNRRTFLLGSGLSLGLPFLECMTPAARAAQPATPPSRLFCAYFPFGVVSRDEDDANAALGWWPIGGRHDFRLSDTLRPLERLRDDVTFFRGFHHNRVRGIGGHNSGDYFLTGAEPRAGQNTISMDQVAANHLGNTRIKSLVLSTDGGVGRPGVSHTMSYTAAGRPIPGLSNPTEIYENLFTGNTPAVRRQLMQDRSVLDLLRESSRSLERQLGHADRQTFDEYLGSVRTLETDVNRAQEWLDATRVAVARDELTLTVRARDGDPRTYLRAMYDLVFHAFRTDTTRVATYQTASMNAADSAAARWPQFLGAANVLAHSLAHAAQPKPQPKSRYDAALLEQFAYFVRRLKETREGESTLLDRTVLLYGSSNSRTHVNSNYPLVLAGGHRLGLRHNQYLKNAAARPLADVMLTMLQACGVPARSFADSSGAMAELRPS